MKKSFWILTSLILTTSFISVEAVCQKCERIREENARKAKDQNWEFYEDWVDIQKKKPDSKSDAPVDSKNKEK